MLRLSSASEQVADTPASAVSENMIRLVLAAAVGATGAAAGETLGHAQEKQAAPPAKTVTLTEAEVRALTGKLGLLHYPGRHKIHTKLEKAEIDEKGMAALFDTMKHPDTEIARRAQELFEHHKELFAAKLYEQYKDRKFMPRNFPVQAWLCCETIQHVAQPKEYISCLQGMSAQAIERRYTDMFTYPNTDRPRPPNHDHWQSAVGPFTQDIIRDAANFYAGRPDAREKMEAVLVDVQEMVDGLAVATDQWHIRNGGKSRLTPVAGAERAP